MVISTLGYMAYTKSSIGSDFRRPTWRMGHFGKIFAKIFQKKFPFLGKNFFEIVKAISFFRENFQKHFHFSGKFLQKFSK